MLWTNPAFQIPKLQISRRPCAPGRNAVGAVAECAVSVGNAETKGVGLLVPDLRQPRDRAPQAVDEAVGLVMGNST